MNPDTRKPFSATLPLLQHYWPIFSQAVPLRDRDLEDPGLEGFARLLAPKTDQELHLMARRASELTRQRFGSVILMYAPLYVSNLCCNSCTYCGFHVNSGAKRGSLTDEEVWAEGEQIRSMGFRHLLLVSGEDKKGVSPERMAALVSTLKQMFPSVSLEVYPMEEEEYRLVRDAGTDGVTLYQETYQRELYAGYHPRGPKSDFDWRLASLDRVGAVGMPRMNVGVLLGLAPFREDALCVAAHALYLQKRFWTSSVAVSVPRMRQAQGGIAPRYPVSDRDLVQLVLAYRLLLPDSPIVLSTREPPEIRDRLPLLGVTQMSAGSKTEPGGYGFKEEGYEAQFHVEDPRTPDQVAQRLRELGLDPVWKDWEGIL